MDRCLGPSRHKSFLRIGRRHSAGYLLEENHTKVLLKDILWCSPRFLTHHHLQSSKPVPKHGNSNLQSAGKATPLVSRSALLMRLEGASW
jgi:hypothetical protein